MEEVGGGAAVGGAGVGRRGWLLSLYAEAGEAGGCWRVPSGSGLSGRRSDPDRSAEEGVRRARGMIRRYCAANRLNRLGTLTYAGVGCHDPAVVRSDAGGFFRRLRSGLGGGAFPYLWVPEWHPGGHGLHLHFAVGRYVKQSLIQELWGKGIVHIKLLGDLPVGSGSLEEARLAARYLGKYAAKALDRDRPAGLHRYEVGQGFKPQPVSVEGGTVEDVIGQASGLMGRGPSRVWHSSRADGWQGPPACWVQWSG